MAAYPDKLDLCSANNTEGVDYFTNILRCYLKPVPYWRLSGHLGQASEELTNYMRKTYPNEQFIQFFQNNNNIFYVDFDGNISLRDLGETIEFFENILNSYSKPLPCWLLQGHLGQAKVIVLNYVRNTYTGKFMNFFKKNDDTFKVDINNNISLNTVRKDAINFFVSVLRHYPQPIPYWRLHGHLSHAPLELRNYMKNTYPLSRFLEFFKNNFAVFCIDTQTNVSLQNQIVIDSMKESKAVEYFISIFKSKYSNPVPYWKLRGHLGQAPCDLIDYLKMTYPQNQFLKFFESNDIFFRVDVNGNVTLKTNIDGIVNKSENASINSILNSDTYILNEEKVNTQSVESLPFDTSSFVISCEKETTENNETEDEVELASKTYLKMKDTFLTIEENFIEENAILTNKYKKDGQVSCKTESKIMCNQTKKREISSETKNHVRLQVKISSEIGSDISFIHHQASTKVSSKTECDDYSGNGSKMSSENDEFQLQRDNFVKNNVELSLQNTNEENCNEIKCLSYSGFKNELFKKIKKNCNVMQIRTSCSKQLSSTFVEANSKIRMNSTDEVFITKDSDVQSNNSSLDAGHFSESDRETCVNNFNASCSHDTNIELKAIEYFQKILTKYSKPVSYQKLHLHLSEATEDVIEYMSQNFPLSHPKFIDFFQNNAIFNVDTNGNISMSSAESEGYNQYIEQTLNDLKIYAIECFNDILPKYFEKNLNWSCVIV